MDPAEHRVLRQESARYTNIRFEESCRENHRQVSNSKELEEWLVVDELLAFWLEFAVIIIKVPSLHGYTYCLDSWTHHASQSVENGSWDAAKVAIQGFLSRLNPSHTGLYNQALGMLHEAAELPSPLVLKELLDQGPNWLLDVNGVRGLHEQTPLMVATRNGHSDHVRILLQQESIDIDLRDIDQQTALFHAVKKKSLPIVDLLIKHKARIDLQDDDGMNPLMYAVKSDEYEIMDLLLQKGARTDTEDVNGLDFFDHATDTCLKGLIRYVVRKIKKQEKEIWGNKMCLA